MCADFDTSILDEVAHRPWAIPVRPWVMTQTWNDLLFAHWPIAPSRLRPHVPEAFDLDLFDGQAWIAIVPFHMTNVGPRGLPALPWVSAFPELNVRTYVRVGDRPGVFFFSLDAASAVAVRAARVLLNLPYYSAAMRVSQTTEGISYQSARRSAPAVFSVTYRPTGPVFASRPGSLEHFLTERYCLYHVGHLGRPYRLDIHHRPWPLQSADARFVRNTMAEFEGISLSIQPPLLHFAKRLDVVAWPPTRPR